jgi:hypothetical protein
MMMSDLQTAMQQILQSWEQPETTKEESTVFKTTTNTSRATFEMVRDNPGLTAKECIRRLEAQGHKKSSSSSLLGQMVRQGHITRNNYGMMYPNGTEYVPLKAVKATKKAKPAKTSKLITSKAPSKEALAMAAEAMDGIGMNGLARQPYRTKIERILDDISLSDAHELYRELHTYFGGLPK